MLEVSEALPKIILFSLTLISLVFFFRAVFRLLNHKKRAEESKAEAEEIMAKLGGLINLESSPAQGLGGFYMNQDYDQNTKNILLLIRIAEEQLTFLKAATYRLARPEESADAEERKIRTIQERKDILQVLSDLINDFKDAI